MAGVPDEDVAKLRDLVLLFGDETSWRSWEGILHAVRTGEAPFEHICGCGWRHRLGAVQHPELGGNR